MTPSNDFLLGAIAAGLLLAALFFLRSWRETGDRLFLLFAVAFAVEGVSRVALAGAGHPSEGQPAFYGARLVAYLIILAGIADKNLRPRR
ncbi:MAG TPA: DUF5985 family protein [Chloroflexota bacterium]|nr:DUF5985 family protein [Chloroflexota bacterium]